MINTNLHFPAIVDPSTDADSFPHFSELPHEIRDMIWREAVLNQKRLCPSVRTAYQVLVEECVNPSEEIRAHYHTSFSRSKGRIESDPFHPWLGDYSKANQTVATPRWTKILPARSYSRGGRSFLTLSDPDADVHRSP